MFPIIQKSTSMLDPVCGMHVDAEQAAGKSTYRNQTYYFCSPGCAAKFEVDPEKYLHPGARLEPMDVEYTCPMHPEVRQIGPGACPKCGMALEPVTFTSANTQEVNPEYVAMLHRFWFSFPLAMALVGMMYLGAHSRWLELALATPVVLWGGWPIFARGWASIVSRHLNMFTLIALGA